MGQNDAKVGKGLQDVLNEVDNEQQDTPAQTKKTDKESFDTLNVEIHTSTAKNLRLLAAFHERTLKDIVNEVMTKYAKREMKKMIADLADE